MPTLPWSQVVPIVSLQLTASMHYVLRWWRWPVLLLICGALLVAHGCHGADVDHELSAPPGPTSTIE